MGEPTGVVTVVGVLQSVVLFDRTGVRQVKPIAGIHQPVDQPVPVEGRFDGDTLELGPVWLEETQDRRQVVAKLRFPNHFLVLVDDRDPAVR